MIKYGDIISKLRDKANLTQEELSKKVGISRAALSHYEKNRREPDYETLQKIADFFEVTTDYLLGRSTHPLLSEERDKEVDKKVNQLLGIIESMPEKKRQEMEAKILAYAQGLADAYDKNK